MFGSTTVAKPQYISNVADLMENLDLRSRIPKLAPAKSLVSINSSTVASTMRSVPSPRHEVDTLSSPRGRHSVGSPRRLEPMMTNFSPTASKSVGFGSPSSSTARGAAPPEIVVTKAEAPASSSSDHKDDESSFAQSTSHSTARAEPSDTAVPPPKPAMMGSPFYHPSMRACTGDEVADLQSTLQSVFAQDPRAWEYFKYLVYFGGPRSRPEYAPEALRHEEHQLLGLLFGALDRDRDGNITADDVHLAASVFPKIGSYSRALFRKIDRMCQGKVDFEYFLLAFFPNHTLRSLQQTRKRLQKPLIKLVTSTRELMSAEDLEEVEKNFYHLEHLSQRNAAAAHKNLLEQVRIKNEEDSSRSLTAADAMLNIRVDTQQPPAAQEGISLETYLSLARDGDARKTAEQVFHLHDMDQDGYLSQDEYLEMVKHNYPPFRRTLPLLVAAPGREIDTRILTAYSNTGRRDFTSEEERQQSRLYEAVLSTGCPTVTHVLPYCMTESATVTIGKKPRHKAAESLEAISRMREAEAKAKVLLR